MPNDKSLSSSVFFLTLETLALRGFSVFELNLFSDDVESSSLFCEKFLGEYLEPFWSNFLIGLLLPKISSSVFSRLRQFGI